MAQADRTQQREMLRKFYSEGRFAPLPSAMKNAHSVANRIDHEHEEALKNNCCQ